MRRFFILSAILALLSVSAQRAEAQRVISIYEAEEAEECCSLPLEPAVRQEASPYTFRATDLVAPGVMLGLGIAGLEWKGLKHVNHKVEDALWNGREKWIRVDDYIQFAPTAATYTLNLCGVKGLHDYVDLTVISGTAYLLATAVTLPSKDFISEIRPRGNAYNSFPSGHTARAFAGAEIMRREFWRVSPWIGVTGYLAATATGFMRLYNGAHWLTDVLAGAGIGILCAEAAYWLYPAVTKALFPKRYNANVFLSPSASPRSLGMAVAVTF